MIKGKWEKRKGIREEFLAWWHVPDPRLRAGEGIWWKELRARMVKEGSGKVARGLWG